MEDAIDEWRYDLHLNEQQSDPHYKGIWSGRAWHADCSHPHCTIPCLRQHQSFVNSGLNLKLTLSIDWFGPHSGKHHGWHSTGALLLRIDNLPERLTSLDRRCAGIYLIGLLPGPQEPKVKELQKYLRVVVDELKMFSSVGKIIPTARYPEGKLVKARLNMVVADSPARAKAAGFSGRRVTGFICPWCEQHADSLGIPGPVSLDNIQSAETDGFVPTRLAAGAHDAVLTELSYFSVLEACPPDPMHAIHLGLCKRFWHLFLVAGCNNINKRLGQAQAVFSAAYLPSRLKRPDKRIGDPSGGLPTAEQWSTLFRVLLPFALMDLWSASLSGAGTEIIDFQPEQKSRRRTVLTGHKPVEDVFRSAMLLSTIVELIEGDFSETTVLLLDSLIKSFNQEQANLLGPGWITFNSHIAEHIAPFIRRFGAPRNFSCLPFERYNGILRRIPTSGQKGGNLETTLMRTSVQRLELRDTLANCSTDFFTTKLLASIESSNQPEGSPEATRIGRKQMDLSTFRLLLLWLNGPDKAIDGSFKAVWDASAVEKDVIITRDAEFVRTLIFAMYPTEIRLAGAGVGGRENLGNTYVMLRRSNGELIAAQILWLFKKSVRWIGPDVEASVIYFLHVRTMPLLSAAEAIGATHPCLDLLTCLKIHFAAVDGGTEEVLPLTSFQAQLAVVPFQSHSNHLLGLKVV